MIHPTAIVSEEAHLGHGVQIGPYAVVEAGAVVGDDCVVGSHVVVGRWVRMGASNVVSSGAVLGGDPQDLRFDPETPSFLRIGDRNRIREHCTLHRATVSGGETVVGDDCFLMAGAHVGHDAKVGSRTILANQVMLGGFVEIGEQVFIGGGGGVHQFVKIGRLAIAQGNSTMTKNVLPYTMVAKLSQTVGLNVVGLRRAGLDAAQRNEIRRAFKLLFVSGRNLQQALLDAHAMSWGPHAAAFWEFAQTAGKRGICPWIGRSATRAEALDSGGAD